MCHSISFSCRSLDEKPVFKVIQCTQSDNRTTLLVETPVPRLWIGDKYICCWSCSVKHHFSGVTQEDALANAEIKIQWILEWEYRKATEIFYSEQRTANSEQRTANSEQRTANSEQRIIDPITVDSI